MNTRDSAALVVEGGAMRGIFSSGVLDVFLEEGFNPFAFAIGTSAGGCNVASYLAGQHGRSRRCYTEYMARPEFISRRRFFRGGHWVDLDWLWNAFDEDHPLDCRRLGGSPARFVVAATSAESGAPVYLEPEPGEVMNVLKGSCAIPILYRGVVRHGAHHLADGGVAAPIPAYEAYRRGARRLLVIRSRPASHVRKGWLEPRIGAWVLRAYPGLAAAYRRAPVTYADAVRFVKRPPSDCAVLHVAPRGPLRSGRVSFDRASLDADYAQGRAVGHAAIRAWCAAYGRAA
jgi:predicted patatin/cPLA2 family phospholipase